MTAVHLKREPYDVRVDRRTLWGNPFSIPRDGDRATVIAKHRAWLASDPEAAEQRRRLPELRGKVLGCWCAPKPCHGDTLGALADALPEGWEGLGDEERRAWIAQEVKA